MSYDKQSGIRNDELLEEIIFRLDNEINNNPKAHTYGFINDFSKIRDISFVDDVELLRNYYNNKGFDVFFENDEVLKIEKIRLKRK